MKRLRKIVLVALGVLLTLLIVALVILYFYLGSIVKTGIETAGPRLTKCPMTVSAVHVAPLRGGFEITGFTIGNPEGFKTPFAIKLGTVRIEVVPRSLFSDTIVVREVFIDAPEIAYEQRLMSSNIATIRKNVTEMAGTGKGAAEPAAPASTKPAKKVVIDRVLVRNGKIRLSVTDLRESERTIPLPEIALKDIGKAGGSESLGEATAVILKAVLDGVTEAVVRNPDFLKGGVEGARKNIEEGASGLLKGANDLFKK